MNKEEGTRHAPIKIRIKMQELGWAKNKYEKKKIKLFICSKIIKQLGIGT